MLQVESFTASTAEPRTMQLGGGGAFTITKDIRPYGGTLPLLTQPAIAKAKCHNIETPLQGGADGSRAEPAVEPVAAGQSPQHQGPHHISRAEPRQANSD